MKAGGFFVVLVMLPLAMLGGCAVLLMSFGGNIADCIAQVPASASPAEVILNSPDVPDGETTTGGKKTDQTPVEVDTNTQGSPDETTSADLGVSSDCGTPVPIAFGSGSVCTVGPADVPIDEAGILIGTTPLTPEQVGYAKLIAGIASTKGLSYRDALTGITTALQESRLTNPVGGDRDSVGLFQQRTSQGWGTPQQLANPVYQVNAFFTRLVEDVPDRRGMPLIEVAIAVQHPDRAAYEATFNSWLIVARQLLKKSSYKPGDPSQTAINFDSACSDAGLVDTGIPGKIVIAAGANLPGQPITPETLNFLARVAGIYGKQLVCTTGTNHSLYTVDGNISDHASGHACDFGMEANGGYDDSPIGDEIMAACLIAARIPSSGAVQAARVGGLYTINDSADGLRIQCIWKTNQGGNHHNHVHVGAIPL